MSKRKRSLKKKYGYGYGSGSNSIILSPVIKNVSGPTSKNYGLKKSIKKNKNIINLLKTSKKKKRSKKISSKFF